MISKEEKENEDIDLSQARIGTTGTYKALYSIEKASAVYDGKPTKVWRGRAMIEPLHDKMPGAKQRLTNGWVYFTREYDDRNDWDRLYHEIEFPDNLFGVPFILVPKEKILFGYDPPPTGGLVIGATPTIQLPKRI